MKYHSLLLLVLLAACQGTRSEPDRGTPIPASAPSAPWTSAFREPSLLVAKRITIEGPDDLVDHVASSQGAGVLYDAETTTRGLVERYRVGGSEFARIQLDAWEIVATERVTVLRRPDINGPVRLIAAGEVYWAETDSGAEERVTERTWTGSRGR